MSPPGWLALAGLATVLLLPAPLVARTAGLATHGRLRGGRSIRGLGLRPSAVVVRRVAVGAGSGLVFAVWWFGGPALAVAALAVAGTGGLLTRDSLRARRRSRRERSLLTALRLLAAELDAGAAPATALSAASALDADTSSLLGAAAAPDGDAAALLADSPDAVVRRVAVAWRLGATGGAALAEVVGRVAADLADRAAARRAVEVAVAGPRSSAVLLSGLPLLGVALGATMGARPLDFLLADPAGRLICCVGVLLNVAGILWLRRMIARVEP